jgi:hypothetical protein
VADGGYQDLAGNAGAGGGTANFTVDTVMPTVTVSINNTDVNVTNGTGTVTFAFSEAPTSSLRRRADVQRPAAIRSQPVR